MSQTFYHRASQCNAYRGYPKNPSRNNRDSEQLDNFRVFGKAFLRIDIRFNKRTPETLYGVPAPLPLIESHQRARSIRSR